MKKRYTAKQISSSAIIARGWGMNLLNRVSAFRAISGATADEVGHMKLARTEHAAALVHEAYMRMVGSSNEQHWNNRGHFFGAAAEAMRRILINHARDKAAPKRGGGWQRMSLDTIVIPGAVDPAKLVAFDDIFDRLIELDPQAGEVAKLRIFAGLTVAEIAEVLNVGARTVDRLWAFARAWLRTQIGDV